MNEREAIERRHADRVLEVLRQYTERAEVIRAPFLKQIRSLDRQMKEALQDAHQGYDAARMKIEADYRDELREIEKRERANAHQDETTR